MRAIQLFACCLLAGLAASECDGDASCAAEKDSASLLQSVVKMHGTDSYEAKDTAEEDEGDQDDTEEGEASLEETEEDEEEDRSLLSARANQFPYKQIMEKVCKSCDQSLGVGGTVDTAGPWYGTMDKQCTKMLKGVGNGDGKMTLPTGPRRRGQCFHPGDNGPPTNGDRRRNKIKLEMNMWVAADGQQPLCACMWKVVSHCSEGGAGYKKYDGRRRKSPVKCVMDEMCQCSGMCKAFKDDSGKCGAEAWDLLEEDSGATTRASQTSNTNGSTNGDSLDESLNDKCVGT